jgi:hypothetical protein
MFGDGVYLAEDMGKSDQYCQQAARGRTLFGGTSKEQQRLDGELWKDGKLPAGAGDLRFVIVCRTVLGVFVQVGEQPTKQLRTGEDVFAAGTRELALIPGLATPTHYHSEVAEVSPKSGVGDTHVESGGIGLRFREFIVFHPTLLCIPTGGLEPPESSRCSRMSCYLRVWARNRAQTPSTWSRIVGSNAVVPRTGPVHIGHHRC